MAQITAGFKWFRRWINASTQRRLLFWSILFWVITLTFLTITFTWIGQNQMVRDTRERNVQLASVISRELNSQLGAIFESTRMFTQRLELLSPEMEAQAAAMLGARVSTPRYRSLYYLDSRGNLLLHLTDTMQNLLAMKDTDEIINRSPVSLPDGAAEAFRNVTGARNYISEVSYTPLDFLPVMYMGMPVNFSSGESRVIVFELDLSDIWQRIDLTTFGQTGIVYTVSRQGTIISHPETSNIGRPIPREISPVLESYEGVTEYDKPSNQRRVIAAYSPVGGATGWGIVVEQEMAEAYSTIQKTGVLIVIIWLALGLIGTASIFVLTRNFMKPIQELIGTVRDITQTGYLRKTGTVQRPDEIGQLSQAFDQMIEQINQAQKAKEEATVAERTRLARELHDAVSQTLFSASLISEVLPRLWERNQEEGRKRLEEIRQLTRGALAEMRTLLFELRPAALKDVDIRDLLKQLGESVTGRSRIPVSLEIQGSCEVPLDVKIALYRICQEALNNIVKHAQASRAGVVMVCTEDGIELRITDDGQGFDPDSTRPGSLGLGIMKERAGSIGAALNVSSRNGHGTQVTAVWKRVE